MVPMTGLEPVRISSEDFKSTVSANSTTSAKKKKKKKTKKGCASFELAFLQVNVAYYHYTIESTNFKRNQPTGELPIPSIIERVIRAKKKRGRVVTRALSEQTGEL